MPRKYSRRRRSSKSSTKRRKSKKMRGGVTVRAQDLKTIKTYLDAERRKLSDAGESEASKRKREKDRQLLKFHDQHPSSGKKKKPRR